MDNTYMNARSQCGQIIVMICPTINSIKYADICGTCSSAYAMRGAHVVQTQHVKLYTMNKCITLIMSILIVFSLNHWCLEDSLLSYCYSCFNRSF